MMIKKIIVLFILSIFICCEMDQRIVLEPKPIEVEKDFMATLAFKKVLIQIPEGKNIGKTAADTPFGNPIFWQKSLSVADQLFNEIVYEELKNTGYNLVGSNKVLFESNNEWEANFLLGARIVELTYNTFFNEDAESKIEVVWELFNVDKREVVFEKKTLGYKRINEIGSACIIEAFRQSFRFLLEIEDFENELKISDGQNSLTTKILIKDVNLPNFNSYSSMIDRVIESVISIKTRKGHGSGFIISDKGYILTNNHVIEGRHILDVVLSNGIKLQAMVLDTNARMDVSILKVKGSGFKPLPFIENKNFVIGEEVYAIGTPISLKFSQSVSKGIISGRRRMNNKEYIQVDIAINPGNSGGPIVNMNGEVIGIVVSKWPDTEGICFSIPIEEAIKALGIMVNK